VYFGILGPLEASNGYGAVRLRGPRQRILLCALLSDVNDVVSVDCLIQWLWPGRVPDSAAATIQEHVSRLRRALDPDRAPWSDSQRLSRRSPGYVLHAGPDEVDALRFELLTSQGQLALERDQPAEAARVLREALCLWRGQALADVTLVEAAQEAIARLEALRLSATALRVDADLALGRHVPLVPELEGLVRQHPLDERLCGQLMTALYRCGRQAQALSVYQQLRRTLDEELGIEPSPVTQKLWAQILAHDPSLDLVGHVAAGCYLWPS
jgi:DNA-binding SARP family transcriptional activator